MFNIIFNIFIKKVCILRKNDFFFACVCVKLSCNTPMDSEFVLPVARPFTTDDEIIHPNGYALPEARPVGPPFATIVIHHVEVIHDVEEIQQPVLETNTDMFSDTDSETDSRAFDEYGDHTTDEEYNSDGEYVCLEDRDDF